MQFLKRVPNFNFLGYRKVAMVLSLLTSRRSMVISPGISLRP